jgi:hypothetical protein
MKVLREYLTESFRIEGITRKLGYIEILALDKFVAQEALTIADVCNLARSFEPKAQLREHDWMNVVVGNHVPPRGGAHITYALDELLNKINNNMISLYEAHVEFETLHPFTDCNGRVGRAIWLRSMLRNETPLRLTFLHWWYYQSLEHSRERTSD